MWNYACIAKLVWAIAKKKDCLWVKWVNRRYIKCRDWWEYTPKGDSSWYWKKLNKAKDKFGVTLRITTRSKRGIIDF